jgi:hypothetical protein
MKVAGTIHSWLYRLSGGKVGGSMGGMPILLLTTTGRKTGRARTWPLGYVADGERLVVVASALGRRTTRRGIPARRGGRGER